jgi:branched-chain amino acid transport system substrate-binding protein
VKAKGGTVVAREFSDNQTVDFSAQLTRLKAENADLIFFGGLDRQAAAVVKRMRQLGMNAQFVGGGGVMDADFLKLAGEAAEGAQAWEYGSPLDKLPQGKAFSDKFQNRFGVAILSYAPFGYDAAWAAVNAMQQANSHDPKVYRPVLKKISFNGITGPIAFDDKGALKNASSTLYQVKNGAWTTVVTKSGI